MTKTKQNKVGLNIALVCQTIFPEYLKNYSLINSEYTHTHTHTNIAIYVSPMKAEKPCVGLGVKMK